MLLGSGVTQHIRISVGLALTGLLLTPAALGFENQWHLGAGLGASGFTKAGGLAPAGGIHGAYGVSDVFDARAEAMLSCQIYGDTNGDCIASGILALTYKVDIIQWIPWVGPGIGIHRLGGQLRSESDSRIQAGPSLLFGMDYAWSREMGVGLAVGLHTMPFDDRRSAVEIAYYTSLVRFEYRWGW